MESGVSGAVDGRGAPLDSASPTACKYAALSINQGTRPRRCIDAQIRNSGRVEVSVEAQDGTAREQLVE